MTDARARIPKRLRHLLRSELEQAIYEAALSRQDELIARRYLIEKIPQIEIAAEFGYDRSTISHRMVDIIDSVTRAAQKLNLT